MQVFKKKLTKAFTVLLIIIFSTNTSSAALMSDATSGDVTATNDVNVTENLDVTGTSTVDGTTTLNGDVNLGSGNDTITVGASGDTVNFDGGFTLTTGQTASFTGTLDANGQIDLGDAGDAITINGSTLDIDSAGTIDIASTNLSLAADGSAVFNELGNAVDFRVEGDTDENLLSIDGSEDFVGIGIATPEHKLDIQANDTDAIERIRNTSTTDNPVDTLPVLSIDLDGDTTTADTDDNLGGLAFRAQNSASAMTEFAYIGGVSDDKTSTSEDGGLDFYVADDATQTLELSIRATSIFAYNDVHIDNGNNLKVTGNAIINGDITGTGDIDFSESDLIDFSSTIYLNSDNTLAEYSSINFWDNDGGETVSAIEVSNGAGDNDDGLNFYTGRDFVNAAMQITDTGSVDTKFDTNIGDGASDALTVNATIQGATPFVFEGATDDGNETSFVISDPDAPQTITFQNGTGTVAFVSDITAQLNDNVPVYATISEHTIADNLTVTEGGGNVSLYLFATDDEVDGDEVVSATILTLYPPAEFSITAEDGASSAVLHGYGGTNGQRTVSTNCGTPTAISSTGLTVCVNNTNNQLIFGSTDIPGGTSLTLDLSMMTIANI